MKRKPKTVTLTTPSGDLRERAVVEVAAALAYSDLAPMERDAVNRRARVLVGMLSGTRGGQR